MVLDIANRLEQSHCPVCIKAFTRVPDLKKALKVRGEFDSFSNEKYESSAIKCHCCPDLHQNVGIEHEVFIRIGIEQL